MSNEIIKEVSDEVNKNFNKERWIWIMLVSAISTLWIAYNVNVERQFNTCREDVRMYQHELREKDSIIDAKNERLVQFYREIQNLQNNNNNGKNTDKRK
jgi:hypothetical protein